MNAQQPVPPANAPQGGAQGGGPGGAPGGGPPPPVPEAAYNQSLTMLQTLQDGNVRGYSKPSAMLLLRNLRRLMCSPTGTSNSIQRGRRQLYIWPIIPQSALNPGEATP